MTPEQNEIFWAIADVQSFMNAVEKANRHANTLTPALQKTLKSWITCYSVILDQYDSPENKLEAEAQSAVDYTLEELKIEKSP